MSNYQESLVNAISIIVDEMINGTEYTKSYIGVVESIKGLESVVRISQASHKCLVMEHLSSQIAVGDIVVVQDLFNDGNNKYIQNIISKGNLG